jgi:hypothetical protein
MFQLHHNRDVQELTILRNYVVGITDRPCAISCVGIMSSGRLRNIVALSYDKECIGTPLYWVQSQILGVFPQDYWREGTSRTRGLPASCENPQYDRIGKEDEDLQWVPQLYPVEAGFVRGWEC